MPEPLITRDVRDYYWHGNVDGETHSNAQKLITHIKKALTALEPLAYGVLEYVIFHLQKVAGNKGSNKEYV